MHKLIVLVALLATACSDRTLSPEEMIDTDGPGDRPASGAWSSCIEQPDCESTPYCVFPADEPGYCAQGCNGGSADACTPAWDGNANLDCVDLTPTEHACALDCAGGRSCPHGMICREVQLPQGVRKLCF